MLICIQIEFELNYIATLLGGGGGGWELPIVAQYLVSVLSLCRFCMGSLMEATRSQVSLPVLQPCFNNLCIHCLTISLSYLSFPPKGCTTLSDVKRIPKVLL